mgnify:CR=1 FL=1
MKPSTLAIFLALSATGCATYGPTWSEISGNRYTYKAPTINRAPALIEKVAGCTRLRKLSDQARAGTARDRHAGHHERLAGWYGIAYDDDDARALQALLPERAVRRAAPAALGAGRRLRRANRWLSSGRTLRACDDSLARP